MPPSLTGGSCIRAYAGNVQISLRYLAGQLCQETDRAKIPTTLIVYVSITISTGNR